MSRQVEADSTMEVEVAEQPTRRGFLGTLTKVALGIVAGVAHLSGEPARAYEDACCYLAKPPSGGYCAYNCWKLASEGYHERTWTCSQAGVSYTCFECTKGATCWEGPWYCSDYWRN
ncbi:MAG TPA: hypothetical protein VHC97_13040 [Thermoanaerobaculia bacterium]|nr:hypothetical protein [Thermoanaerobaculia bacterium]